MILPEDPLHEYRYEAKGNDNFLFLYVLRVLRIHCVSSTTSALTLTRSITTTASTM